MQRSSAPSKAAKSRPTFNQTTQAKLNKAITITASRDAGTLTIPTARVSRANHFADFGPPSNFPEMGITKNKLLIPVTFFTLENVTTKPPHSPCKPPQIHHQNTTFCHSFSEKPPAKTQKAHSPKNPPHSLGERDGFFSSLRNNFSGGSEAELMDRHPGLGVGVESVRGNGAGFSQSIKVVDQGKATVLIAELRYVENVF